MSIATVQDLFLDELKDIYSAEKQAVRSYPRIAKAASSEELKQALQKHLEQTKGQIERLDKAFEILEKRAGGKTCEAMKGLLEEAAESIEEIESGPVLDVAIIAAAQRIEHYEIAAYGTVATLAGAMGQTEIQQLLSETLQEEKDTDELLTGVAGSVNAEALGNSKEDDEEDGEDIEDDDEEDEGPTSAPKKAVKSAAKSKSKK
jgi:ferritin-like metal-binding protein YciE